MEGVRHRYTAPQDDEFSKEFNLPVLKYDQQADKKSWEAMHQFFQRVFAQ